MHLISHLCTLVWLQVVTNPEVLSHSPMSMDMYILYHLSPKAVDVLVAKSTELVRTGQAQLVPCSLAVLNKEHSAVAMNVAMAAELSQPADQKRLNHKHNHIMVNIELEV